MKRYVIIGNGTAATGCIEGIRSTDSSAAITVVSAEKHPVYCRPLISYYLQGKTDLTWMRYRAADFYEKNGCTVLYGKRAVQLNTAKKTVALDDGTQLPYDAVCVAAGSTPFVPPMPGLEGVQNHFSFMTLDDTLAIEKALCPTSRVLIVGAGLIGLKCAEGLHGRVGSITVCDLAESVLSSILDGDSAAIVQRHLAGKGIHFLLGNSVAEFHGNSARMRNGETVPFDILITAVGVRANTALVQEAGGACGRGITVNTAMQTTLPSVYAAGDCTESTDITDGAVKVMALLPNAYMQGHCAGVNMAGGEALFDNAIPMNAIGFFGLHIMTAGSHAPDGEAYEEATEHTLKKLFVRDNRLIRFILVGCVERAGIYTSLIRSKTPLDTVDFAQLKKTPDLSAFDENYRRKTLGGVL